MRRVCDHGLAVERCIHDVASYRHNVGCQDIRAAYENRIAPSEPSSSQRCRGRPATGTNLNESGQNRCMHVPEKNGGVHLTTVHSKREGRK
jgi:hypothetical protein